MDVEAVGGSRRTSAALAAIRKSRNSASSLLQPSLLWSLKLSMTSIRSELRTHAHKQRAYQNANAPACCEELSQDEEVVDDRFRRPDEQEVERKAARTPLSPPSSSSPLPSSRPPLCPRGLSRRQGEDGRDRVQVLRPRGHGQLRQIQQGRRRGPGQDASGPRLAPCAHLSHSRARATFGCSPCHASVASLASLDSSSR